MYLFDREIDQRPDGGPGGSGELQLFPHWGASLQAGFLGFNAKPYIIVMLWCKVAGALTVAQLQSGRACHEPVSE